MKDNVADYYPNALCFNNKKKIQLLSNWFDEKYNNIFVSIDACRNSPEKTHKSKPIREIEEFIEQNVFYIVSQKTTVNKEIYEEDSDNYFDDESGYFPLQKGPKSLFYSTLPGRQKGILPIFEMMIGLDKIEVDDSKYQMGLMKRSKEFLNVKSTRSISDVQSSYSVKDYKL